MSRLPVITDEDDEMGVGLLRSLLCEAAQNEGIDILSCIGGDALLCGDCQLAIGGGESTEEHAIALLLQILGE